MFRVFFLSDLFSTSQKTKERTRKNNNNKTTHPSGDRRVHVPLQHEPHGPLGAHRGHRGRGGDPSRPRLLPAEAAPEPRRAADDRVQRQRRGPRGVELRAGGGLRGGEDVELGRGARLAGNDER